jgi:RNA polymerase sigma-70 factor (ECF subfamily)
MTNPHPTGTAETISQVLGRVRPALERVLGSYDIPPEDAEDVLQDTYLTLLYKWEKVQCPEAWLVGTLRKKCIMYWRKRRKRIVDAMDAAILELLSEPERPSQERQDLSRDFDRVLGRLPERCQRLLRLRYGLGLGPSEVAARMGYQPSSIRKITSRCLTTLSRELAAVGFLEREP